MSKSIITQNGILTIPEVYFKCPNCDKEFAEKDYYKQLYNSKKHMIHKTCKGCNKKIGITTDMVGDVKVWIKDDAGKNNCI